MITSSEVKLFCQSALTMVGFLMAFSLIGSVYQPRAASVQPAVATVRAQK